MRPIVLLMAVQAIILAAFVGAASYTMMTGSKTGGVIVAFTAVAAYAGFTRWWAWRHDPATRPRRTPAPWDHSA